MMLYKTLLVSQLIFSWVATWSYEQRGNTVLNFAGRIPSELLNNAALLFLHVVGLTSHSSFFVRLQIFLTGLTSGDCRGNSILRLALFSSHVNTAMALWQGALSCWNTNGCCWCLDICCTESSNFPPMRCKNTGWHFHQPLPKCQRKKADASQTITGTLLRSRNRIASGFILYQFFLQHPPLPSLVCKINLHSSESTTIDHFTNCCPVPNYLGGPEVILPF